MEKRYPQIVGTISLLLPISLPPSLRSRPLPPPPFPRPALLHQEPKNPFDPNALAIHTEGEINAQTQIGYIPRAFAAALSPLLSRGLVVLSPSLHAPSTIAVAVEFINGIKQQTQEDIIIQQQTNDAELYSEADSVLLSSFFYCLSPSFDPSPLYRASSPIVVDRSDTPTIEFQNFIATLRSLPLLPSPACLLRPLDSLLLSHYLCLSVPHQFFLYRLLQRKYQNRAIFYEGHDKATIMNGMRWWPVDSLKFRSPGPETPVQVKETVEILKAVEIREKQEITKEKGKAAIDDANVMRFIESSKGSMWIPCESFYREWLSCLTVPALKELHSHFTNKAGAPAQDLKAAMINYLKKQKTLFGGCLINCRDTRKALTGRVCEYIRIGPRFATLIERAIRLAKIRQAEEAIANTSGDGGDVKACDVESPRASLIFPDSATFYRYCHSLDLLDMMNFAMGRSDDSNTAASFALHPSAASAASAPPSSSSAPLHVGACYAIYSQARRRLEQGRKGKHTQQEDKEEAIDYSFACEQYDLYEDPRSVGDYERLFKPLAIDADAGASGRVSAHPHYGEHFRASHIYGEICHLAVGLLEKDKLYDAAVCLLYRLLELPVLLSRRGGHWNRLMLNIATHIGNTRAAFALAPLALADPSVTCGDAVELRRRVLRLWRHRQGGDGKGEPPFTGYIAVEFGDERAKRRSTKALEEPREASGPKKSAGKKAAKGARSSLADAEDSDEAEELTDIPSKCDRINIVHNVSADNGDSGDSLSAASPPLLNLCPRIFTSLFVSTRPLLIGVTRLHGRPINSDGSKSRFYNSRDELGSVEALALDHYGQCGWTGRHEENALFAHLFGIFMADLLAAEKGAQTAGDKNNNNNHASASYSGRSEFAEAPLDLLTPRFYFTHQPAIARLLQSIRAAASLAPWLQAVHQASTSGRPCFGVQWDRFSLSDTIDIVDCMGAASLANICDLMSRDYQAWRGGLPDLVMWRKSATNNEEGKSQQNGDEADSKMSGKKAAEKRVAVEVIDSDSDPSPAPHDERARISAMCAAVESDDDRPVQSARPSSSPLSARPRPSAALQARRLANKRRKAAGGAAEAMDVENVEGEDIEQTVQNTPIKNESISSVVSPSSSSSNSLSRFKLVEVKGPRDRLSSQQLAWLYVLGQFMDVEICLIKENMQQVKGK